MKIIDLLNKIANGEEAPNKIKWEDREWKYNPINDYEGIKYGGFLLNQLTLDRLNDEIEIIEEEPRNIEVCGSLFTKSEYDKLVQSGEKKKIPEKLNLGNATVNEQQIEFKINEIIDYLKNKGE